MKTSASQMTDWMTEMQLFLLFFMQFVGSSVEYAGN